MPPHWEDSPVRKWWHLGGGRVGLWPAAQRGRRVGELAPVAYWSVEGDISGGQRIEMQLVLSTASPHSAVGHKKTTGHPSTARSRRGQKSHLKKGFLFIY